jgi:hypothetical protein
MIHDSNPNDGYYKYIINNKEYYLPNYGFQIKIIDFGLSIFDRFDKFDKFDNNEFENMDSIGILNLYSPYYDLHTIINEIYIKSQFIYDKYPKFFKFLLEIVDIKYIGNNNKYINMFWRLYFPYKFDYFIKNMNFVTKDNIFFKFNINSNKNSIYYCINKAINDKSYLSTIKTPLEALELFTMYLLPINDTNIIDTYIS